MTSYNSIALELKDLESDYYVNKDSLSMANEFFDTYIQTGFVSKNCEIHQDQYNEIVFIWHKKDIGDLTLVFCKEGAIKYRFDIVNDTRAKTGSVFLSTFMESALKSLLNIYK